MDGVKIIGVGKAVPKKTLTNEEIATFVETSNQWIKERTGIEERRIAIEETTTSLAVSAAKEAIDEAKIEAETIELVIVATASPDSVMPNTACLVADALGIKNATCFDLSAACSGFLYASEVACSMMRVGRYKRALVIGAETLSKVVDWEDRGTCILFADGAGATLYEGTNENKVLAFKTQSDGSGAKYLELSASYKANRFHQEEPQHPFIVMNGQEVYKFAVTKVPQNIKALLEETPYDVQDIDWFILHQANERIITSVAKKLGVAEEKFFKNIQHYGNTSAASIPIALKEAQNKLKKGDKVLLAGFGAGLTWGSMLFIVS
ncbi:3-oxoacyl-ACP synthase [Sporanaerobium hydrogeniformans]|uniref:3-oxoacyl-ACP synthase n=1 Tax=Sporanaerobium hydrogeniformans TaxID=3072179 RepID=A0AC61DCC8_9FIRM|nr:beta-ketoacyl-ACP synthase III [Sporanaerobium hydrogeniformans]PHV70420.1 3-oxoacyl-ACP synthase [Sporanaerobium hydrogeniformans]